MYCIITSYNSSAEWPLIAGNRFTRETMVCCPLSILLPGSPPALQIICWCCFQKDRTGNDLSLQWWATTQWRFCLGRLTEHLFCKPHSSRVTKHFWVLDNKLQSCSKRPDLTRTVSQRTVAGGDARIPARGYLPSKFPRRFWEISRGGGKGEAVPCQPHLREKISSWPRSVNQLSYTPMSKMHHKPPDDFMSPVSFLHPVSD